LEVQGDLQARIYTLRLEMILFQWTRSIIYQKN